MIVRFEDSLLAVIHQPKHACLFDRGPYLRNRFKQRHPQPLWRVVVRPVSPGIRSAQNATHGCPADLKPPRDLGFGNTGTMQFTDLGGVQSRS